MFIYRGWSLVGTDPLSVLPLGVCVRFNGTELVLGPAPDKAEFKVQVLAMDGTVWCEIEVKREGGIFTTSGLYDTLESQRQHRRGHGSADYALRLIDVIANAAEQFVFTHPAG